AEFPPCPREARRHFAPGRSGATFGGPSPTSKGVTEMRSLYLAGLLGLAASAAVLGCALEPGSDTETTTSDGSRNTGTGRLELQGPAANGTVYRLRQATFTISTTPPTTLSSDANPANATALTATLPAGSYSVSLQNGWVLDRVNAQGTTQPVVANLVSANP